MVWIVHRSMRDDSRVEDEVYIKRVLLALECFLFFSLYSFSCKAKQVTTLNQLRVLSCLDSSTCTSSALFCFDITLFVTNITYARSRPLHSNESYNLVPDNQCAYISRLGVSIVPNLVLFLVGCI